MRILLPLLAAAFLLLAEEKKTDPVRVPALLEIRNADCPVTGKRIEKGTTADWNGVRVRFCCEKCSAAFLKEPVPVLEKLGFKVAGTKEQPVLDLANAKCPIMGKPAKESVHADVDGFRIRFCCEGCDKKTRKDPAAAFATLGYLYHPAVIDLRNKACPVTGDATHEGEGEVFADHDGIRVRFCCDDCIAAFRKDPAAAFAKLGVDPAKLKAELK